MTEAIPIAEARRRRAKDRRVKRETGADGRRASWMNLCTRTATGDVDGASVRNVMIALRHAPEWRDVLAFDEFALRYVIRREIPAAGEAAIRRLPRMLEDSDVVAALEWFHAQSMVRLRTTMLYDAMLLHARDDSRFHPVIDFFDDVMAGD